MSNLQVPHIGRPIEVASTVRGEARCGSGAIRAVGPVRAEVVEHSLGLGLCWAGNQRQRQKHGKCQGAADTPAAGFVEPNLGLASEMFKRTVRILGECWRVMGNLLSGGQSRSDQSSGGRFRNGLQARRVWGMFGRC